MRGNFYLDFETQITNRSLSLIDISRRLIKKEMVRIANNVDHHSLKKLS